MQTKIKNQIYSILQHQENAIRKTLSLGGYNFTFQTFHNGNSVTNKRLLNYFGNEKLYPNNFEIYPQINSVFPQSGSVTGGTLITIQGKA